MRCPLCGKELPSNAVFCTECGAKLGNGDKRVMQTDLQTPQGHPTGEFAKKPPLKKKNLMILVIVAAITVLMLAVLFLVSNRPINRFESAVKKREISSAWQIYNDLPLDERKEAISRLSNLIDQLEEGYYNGKYEYTDVTDRLKDLLRFDELADKVDESLEQIDVDNQCTIAYQKAQQYAEQEKWKQAYEILRAFDSSYRKYDDVVALRATCIQQYKASVLLQCDQLAATSKYQEVLSLLDGALNLLPNDPELTANQQKYDSKFEDVSLAEADKLAADGKYEEAITYLQNAQKFYHVDSFTDAMSKYEEAIKQEQYQTLKTEAERIRSESGLKAAVEYLLNMEEHGSFDNNCDDLLTDYKKDYSAEVLATAAEKAEARDFEGAIAILKEAEHLCKTQEITDAISDYEKYLPIDLATCHMLDSSDFPAPKVDVRAIDDFGNSYDHAITFLGSNKDIGFVTFYTNRRFQNITGVIAPYQCKTTGYISIYADDAEIYKSTEFSRVTEPFSFNVNIESCSQLRIEFHRTGDAYLTGWGAVLSARLS